MEQRYIYGKESIPNVAPSTCLPIAQNIGGKKLWQSIAQKTFWQSIAQKTFWQKKYWWIG